LLKVLARATFPKPAARFRDAREMADALRQAGRAGAPVRAERPIRSRSNSQPDLPQNIARIPTVRSEPPKVAQHDEDREDRKLALLLVTAAMILLLMLVAAGWFLIRRDGTAVPLPPGGTATSAVPRTSA
jgi:hypothetical protein